MEKNCHEMWERDVAAYDHCPICLAEKVATLERELAAARTLIEALQSEGRRSESEVNRYRGNSGPW